MKRLLILACGILLCGCGKKEVAPTAVATPNAETTVEVQEEPEVQVKTIEDAEVVTYGEDGEGIPVSADEVKGSPGIGADMPRYSDAYAELPISDEDVVVYGDMLLPKEPTEEQIELIEKENPDITFNTITGEWVSSKGIVNE